MAMMMYAKTTIMRYTCPLLVILRNMPKMYRGSKGIMALAMTLATTSLNSAARLRNDCRLP